MFRLAHISDVHLRPMPNVSVSQLFNKRITGYVNWKLNRKHNLAGNHFDQLLEKMHSDKPDHTVVTGDLVNLALPAEIANAQRFLEQLGEPADVTAMFGNHDAYVPGALKNAIARWGPYLSGDNAPLKAVDQYPILRVRGNVAIIACNSARATLPFLATGYFRRRQADRLAEILVQTKAQFRIVCIHHPPVSRATRWYKRLVGQGLFRRTIKNHGAELVLHGHTHLSTTNLIDANNRKIPVICAPAAGNSHGGKKPEGRYNLFSISKENENWVLRHQAKTISAQDGSLTIAEDQTFKLPLHQEASY